ncbi:MAG TPA: energy-coupling factor transporter ATPase [Chloroflexi bacterium]|nr:energy-coupling factor transporter ATPase [Chloroflexota bacterium]
MKEPLVRVQNVSHVYNAGTPAAVVALRQVNLDVQPGEYVVILGHNGSGKSTLAKHLNGLLIPTEGEVLVKGLSTADPANRREIRSTVGMVFQTPDNQLVATVVEEDVAFGPENLGIERAELRRRVEWALDVVEIQAYRHRAPHLLSGGQKQRVAIAGIIAMRPEVLVLDESTALLDPLGRQEVMQTVRRLNRDEGVTVVAITHFMEEAVEADRVLVMEQGQIVMVGTPREVFAQTERLHTLGLDVPQVTELAQRLVLRHPDIPRDVLQVDELVAVLAPGSQGTDEPESRGAGGDGQVSSLSPKPEPLVEALATEKAPCEPLVEISGLEHTYMKGTPLATKALFGVDFVVCRGETVAVLGHTGSGKSTLMQHLNGLLRPDRGQVRILDYDLSDPSLDLRRLRQRVGLVFQFPEAQLFEKYVGDDIAFGPRQLKLSREDVRERVREAMEAVGLSFESFKDRYTFSLSGGEKRRVALAGVLALRPEVLVLDEPTAGLDPRGRDELLGLLTELKARWGLTVVLVSHNMEEVARLADRAYVMAQGRTVAEGTPRALFQAPQMLLEVGLGIPQVTAALHALADRGLAVRRDALTVPEAATSIEQALSGVAL